MQTLESRALSAHAASEERRRALRDEATNTFRRQAVNRLVEVLEVDRDEVTVIDMHVKYQGPHKAPKGTLYAVVSSLDFKVERERSEGSMIAKVRDHNADRERWHMVFRLAQLGRLISEGEV